MTALSSDNPQVRRVGSFHELVTARFADGVNAVCWERSLPGDYAEVVARLSRPSPSLWPVRPEQMVQAKVEGGRQMTDDGRRQPEDGKLTAEGGLEPIVTLDETTLRGLSLSAAGRVAAEQMLADLRLLRDHALDPVLNLIHGYPRDEEAGPVPVDVFSFHADSAPVEADTFLCTYFGPASEGLRNDEARRRVDVPETRAALLAQFGGADNGDFQAHLTEHCYDLHYAPLPHARPFSFGLGNLWRLAISHPESAVPPCIHRAPATAPGESRLLLIS